MSDERWKESEQGCWMRRFGTFHDSACIIDGVLHVNAQAVITHIPLDVLGHMLSRAGLALVPAADVRNPETVHVAGQEWQRLTYDEGFRDGKAYYGTVATPEERRIIKASLAFPDEALAHQPIPSRLRGAVSDASYEWTEAVIAAKEAAKEKTRA